MPLASEIARAADLGGKTVVITGASSGLGAETARALALTGANIVITGRNMASGSEVLAELRQAGSGRHLLLPLDLADPADVHRFARQVAGEFEAIDIVVANAGCAQTPQDRLENGFDVRFAANYLGHFLLAHALLDRLSVRGARLVVLGSAGHKGRPVCIADLAWRERDIDQRRAYGESKSALSLFCVEATRRWHDRGIFANCVLPGSVVTGLLRHHSPERMAAMFKTGGAGKSGSMFKSAEEGAATSVWAAVAPELDRVGGLVLESCGPCPISGPDMHPFLGYELHATDSETARRLWDATLAIIAAENLDFVDD